MNTVAKRCLQSIFLASCTLLGFVLGFYILPRQDLISTVAITLVSLPGVIWMNMLNFVAFPLAFTNVITAVSSLKPKILGKLAWRASFYFMLMNTLAAIVGIVLALALEPGRIEGAGRRRGQTLGTRTDVNITRYTVFNSNASIGQDETRVSVHDKRERLLVATFFKFKQGFMEPSEEETAVLCPGFISSFLMVNLASVASGLLLARMGKNGRPLTKSLGIVNDHLMRAVAVLSWFAPVGICSLIAARVAEMDNTLVTLSRLGQFIATVSVGLIIHGVVMNTFIFFVVKRSSVFVYWSGVKHVIMITFGTGSSIVTLPATIESLELHNGLDRRVSRLLLPLATTLKMDGSIMYHTITVMFIAQFNDVNINLGTLFLICLVAIVVPSISGGTPSSGVISLVLLQAVNLPRHGMEFVFAIAWFMGRLCTTVDVMSTIAGAGVLASLSRDDLMSDSIQRIQEKKRSRTFQQLV